MYLHIVRVYHYSVHFTHNVRIGFGIYTRMWHFMYDQRGRKNSPES